MKKVKMLLILLPFLMVSASLSAKCYTFQKGGDYKVCVPGDGFSDRKKAMEICKSKKGSDCGGVSSNSSSCHSNSGKCYNEKGEDARSYSGY